MTIPDDPLVDAARLLCATLAAQVRPALATVCAADGPRSRRHARWVLLAALADVQAQVTWCELHAHVRDHELDAVDALGVQLLLVRALLDEARARAARLDLDPTRTDVSALLSRVLSDLETEATALHSIAEMRSRMCLTADASADCGPFDVR